MIVLLGPYVKAYDGFTGYPVPGAVKANTDTMTLTIALGGGPVVSSRARQMNFVVRVEPDAPDEVKRQYPVFTNPLFAAPPPGV